MMLGRRKEEQNRTFLGRKCTYFSIKLIIKKKKKKKKKKRKKKSIFFLKYNSRRKRMQTNESIMCFFFFSFCCELKIPPLGITVRHPSTSLVMPNSYLHDEIFNPHLTTITDSYNPLLELHLKQKRFEKYVFVFSMKNMNFVSRD